MSSLISKISTIESERQKSENSLRESIEESARKFVEAQKQHAKEVAEAKLKLEVVVNEKQKDLIQFERRITEAKATRITEATTVVAKASPEVSEGSIVVISTAVTTTTPPPQASEDRDKVKSYLKEAERKLAEERKLYAILREDFNRQEQQLNHLKSEKESKKKENKKDKTQAEETTSAATSTVTSTTSASTAVAAPHKRTNKAYAEVEERRIKDLELSLLKLKEENAVIRSQVREQYEREARSLR